MAFKIYDLNILSISFMEEDGKQQSLIKAGDEDTQMQCPSVATDEHFCRAGFTAV